VTNQDLGEIGIVGAGQVGTMLGWALRSAGASVTVFDARREVAQRSRARGAANAVASSLEAVLGADSVILAVPVPQIVSLLRSHADRLRAGGFLIDTGSVKLPVVEAMAACVRTRVHAIGGHPLAGTERPGPEGADPERLRGAAFALAPVRDDKEAERRGRLLAEAVGAIPVLVDAATHDRTLAVTSHLAHLAAFAAAAAATSQAASGAFEPALVSTGFRGLTRLAASDPAMVAGFLSANAEQIAAASSAFERELSELVAASRGAVAALATRLSEASAGLARLFPAPGTERA